MDETSVGVRKNQRIIFENIFGETELAQPHLISELNRAEFNDFLCLEAIQSVNGGELPVFKIYIRRIEPGKTVVAVIVIDLPEFGGWLEQRLDKTLFLDAD